MMTGLIGFDYPARTRIVFGVGAIDRVGDLAKGLGRSRALLVTDQGIVKAVGNCKKDYSVIAIALDVKVGDKVLFGKYSGQNVKLDGE